MKGKVAISRKANNDVRAAEQSEKSQLIFAMSVRGNKTTARKGSIRT